MKFAEFSDRIIMTEGDKQSPKILDIFAGMGITFCLLLIPMIGGMMSMLFYHNFLSSKSRDQTESRDSVVLHVIFRLAGATEASEAEKVRKTLDLKYAQVWQDVEIVRRELKLLDDDYNERILALSDLIKSLVEESHVRRGQMIDLQKQLQVELERKRGVELELQRHKLFQIIDRKRIQSNKTANAC